ncbi:hypothetical protein [Streptomyces viridochromogenes]|uniref:Secreted protein n=1 Tax=Streptomyces viridochromogenes Tue57 TaxID=1160705 RepID=L8PLY7_STRVR|nr:hypothetical protein [Streptomyces viridochromogenes]ELS58571.1 hypothetical protein STVIR_0467 [Streptomyces viridochromogenes Tue57]
MSDRPKARRGALLLAAASFLGLLSHSTSSARATPPPSPAASRPALDEPPASCLPADLPRTAPRASAVASAARAVQACLDTAEAPHSDPDGARLRARTLTVTGLYCPLSLAEGVCRAERVTLEYVHAGFPGTSGEAGSCTSARRLTFSGDVRFRASAISGHVFGLLPLTLSTATVPPVPLPYLSLTNVEASGLWARARRGSGQHMKVTPGEAGPVCPADRGRGR